MADNVLFDMPISPQEFGVALDPPNLRRLDYSALDFEMMRRAGVEYIRTYFPDEFNDFFASNGVIMFLELVSFVGNALSEREDILVDESFLSTAQSKESVIQHLELIDQQIKKATTASVEVNVSVSFPVVTEVIIPAGLVFQFSGPDGQPLMFELFRAPEDYTSSIAIMPGKRGVVAIAIEGQFGQPIIIISPGGSNQYIDIMNNKVLDTPITVDVTTGSTTERWLRIPIIEKARARDKVYEVRQLESTTRIVFGDGTAGQPPLAGQTITVSYRVGGGVRGRIGSNFINETRQISPQPPATAPVDVLFRNLVPSVGGTDEETIDQAKARAPKDFATHDSAVTGEDYGQLASSYIHPVFGAVAKAIGTIRTGIEADVLTVSQAIRAASSDEEGAAILLDNYVNRNIAEIYILADGQDGPVVPSVGLKKGLVSFFEEINVLTDEVRVLDGAVKAVDITATIVMSRSADAGTVKENVINAINDFFNIKNFDMGNGLTLSNLYELIQGVPGIKFVNIFNPTDNILPVKVAGPTTEPNTVGFNELIVLGNLDLKFFYELGAFTR